MILSCANTFDEKGMVKNMEYWLCHTDNGMDNDYYYDNGAEAFADFAAMKQTLKTGSISIIDADGSVLLEHDIRKASRSAMVEREAAVIKHYFRMMVLGLIGLAIVGIGYWIYFQIFY